MIHPLEVACLFRRFFSQIIKIVFINDRRPMGRIGKRDSWGPNETSAAGYSPISGDVQTERRAKLSFLTLGQRPSRRTGGCTGAPGKKRLESVLRETYVYPRRLCTRADYGNS